MFDENEDFEQNYLTNDIERFERFLQGEAFGYLDSDRWEALIDHWMTQGEFKRAKITAEEALSQYGYKQLFKLRLAQSMMASGQLKDALDVLDEIENSSAPSCEVLLTKASIFSQLRDHKSAIQFFHGAAVLAEPEDVCEIYWDLANEYQQLGEFKQASIVLQKAIEVEPSNEGVMYELAFCFEKLGKYEDCISLYERFIDENPYSYSAWYNLGNVFLQLENYKKAVWAYDYSVLINSEFPPVHFNLANAYLGMEKFEEAIEHYNEYIRLNGPDETSLCYLGECYEHLGALDLAKSCYQHSLEINPKLPDAWLGMGILEDLNGNTKEAIVLIQKALELAPKNSGIYHVLAGAFEKVEAYELAQEHYEKAIQLDPNDEECVQNYVTFISNVHGKIEALNYISEFQTTYPKVALAKLLQVDLLWQLEDKAKAVEVFSKCAKEDINYAKKLFEINPALKNIEDFVHLTN